MWDKLEEDFMTESWTTWDMSKMKHKHSSIHVVFLRNWLYLGRTDLTSLSMRFGKWGRGLLLEGKRREGEWAVWTKGGGNNRKYRSCRTKVNTAAMSVIIFNSKNIQYFNHSNFSPEEDSFMSWNNYCAKIYKFLNSKQNTFLIQTS